MIQEQYDWNVIGCQFLDLVEAPHGDKVLAGVQLNTRECSQGH